MQGIHNGRSLRLCIAEDDRDSREVLQRMLQVLGHQVVCTVDNGQDVVSQAANLEVDVVLVDLEMPMVDGLEAAEEIWNSKQTPVVLVTGHPDVHHMVLENEPVVGYLKKPFTLDALRNALTEAVAMGRAAHSRK